jgi:lipoprotein-anchoring transpeptidase ErfK/SrfK
MDIMGLRLLLAAAILLHAELAYAAKVVISINERSQRMIVSIDGQREYVWPVSTGIAGYATPSGTYKSFRMEPYHFSEEWDDAPMPHSIFFTPVGHAIHGTEHVEKLGRRASHGCVRLDPDNAATLFALVEEVGMANTTVVVRGIADKTRIKERRQRQYPKPQLDGPIFGSDGLY